MSRTNGNGKRWFTAADVLITVIVLALAAGSVALFVLAGQEGSTAEPVEVSMLIHLADVPEGFSKGDKVFCGTELIGTIDRVDKSANNVSITVTLDKDEGEYLLAGNSVRINGSFVLETRLRRATGVIESMDERGGE